MNDPLQSIRRFEVTSGLDCSLDEDFAVAIRRSRVAGRLLDDA
jgi:hypothetical protein